MTTGWKWLDDRTRDCADVAEAMRVGLTTYAVPAAIRRLGEDMRGVVEAIVPALKLALGIVGASAAIGGVIGGVGGAFLGGAGAVPGAVSGVSTGASAGLALLSLLGLAFLIEFVGDRLGEVGAMLDLGFEAALEANGSEPRIDIAAQRFGDAMGLFVTLVVEGLVLLCVSRGMTAGVKAIRSSRLGAGLAGVLERSPAFRRRVNMRFYTDKLGIKNINAQMQTNIRTAVEFLEEAGHGPQKIASFLKAIDLHSPVKVVVLDTGTRLIQRTMGEVGSWWSRSGTSSRSLGIASGESVPGIAKLRSDAMRSGNAAARTRLAERASSLRQNVETVLSSSTRALQSRAAAARDTWTGAEAVSRNQRLSALHDALAKAKPGESAAIQAEIKALKLEAYKKGVVAPGGGEQFFIPNGSPGTMGPVPIRPAAASRNGRN